MDPGIAIDVMLGDSVELNSGGPPMSIVEIVTHGKNGGTDIVAWWRAADGKPQILEIDARCVRVAIARLCKLAEGAEAEAPAGADLLPPEERARRTRLAWWADLTDEHRLALIGQCCTSCGTLNPSCRCGDDS